jgi:uncharacterized protein with HEPN domain
MPRDWRAYLADVIGACDAIEEAVQDLDLNAYEESRLIRSSVEREFIIIGEALSALHRETSEHFDRISRARRIIDFRNQLTHQYPTIDDAIVGQSSATMCPYCDLSVPLKWTLPTHLIRLIPTTHLDSH